MNAFVPLSFFFYQLTAYFINRELLKWYLSNVQGNYFWVVVFLDDFFFCLFKKFFHIYFILRTYTFFHWKTFLKNIGKFKKFIYQTFDSGKNKHEYFCPQVFHTLFSRILSILILKKLNHNILHVLILDLIYVHVKENYKAIFLNSDFTYSCWSQDLMMWLPYFTFHQITNLVRSEDYTLLVCKNACQYHKYLQKIWNFRVRKKTVYYNSSSKENNSIALIFWIAGLTRKCSKGWVLPGRGVH